MLHAPIPPYLTPYHSTACHVLMHTNIPLYLYTCTVPILVCDSICFSLLQVFAHACACKNTCSAALLGSTHESDVHGMHNNMHVTYPSFFARSRAAACTGSAHESDVHGMYNMQVTYPSPSLDYVRQQAHDQQIMQTTKQTNPTQITTNSSCIERRVWFTVLLPLLSQSLLYCMHIQRHAHTNHAHLPVVPVLL